MMIIMRTDASQKEIDAVIERVRSGGLQAHISVGEERTVIGAVGDGRQIFRDQFLLLSGVDRVMPISRPYKLASREFRPEDFSFSDRRRSDWRTWSDHYRRTLLCGGPNSAVGNRSSGA